MPKPFAFEQQRRREYDSDHTRYAGELCSLAMDFRGDGAAEPDSEPRSPPLVFRRTSGRPALDYLRMMASDDQFVREERQS